MVLSSGRRPALGGLLVESARRQPAKAALVRGIGLQSSIRHPLQFRVLVVGLATNCQHATRTRT